MVTQEERNILRAEIRSRGNNLSAADRETLIKPYLPDPADLPQTRSRASTANSSSHSRRQKARKTPIRTFIKSQIHHLTYALTHIIFGIIVRLLQAYHAVVDRVFAVVYHHHRTPELIRKDVRGLKRLPQHLSVILTLRTEDDALAVLMDEVAELTAWSACAGISQLSIYEKTEGRLIENPHEFRCLEILYSSSASDGHRQARILLRFTLTTAPLQLFAPHHAVYGATSGSKSEVPPLTLLLLSATDGRETMVDLTKTLAEMSQNGKLSPEDITPELVDAELSEITSQPLQPEGETDRIPANIINPEPDLLLIFGPYLKLDGYPPWQIRLTEMYCTGDRSHGVAGFGEAVEYQGFMRGLWHYAGAQMRFGR
ncbi:uncharacterized protein N7484_000114 [Penicillium longicatenatum]|uniref:uncharacterized protein n=1 Tax=Penicillium longicatenatum TaxID=1561947 RepID=UPI00254915E5|nr:uncharacterized protein N7484_000114 [Penicillium longicatenatum]KAJ5660742.1 hypothetical protein N7484_000114 [Penicillium longicatenatum]